MNPLDLVISRQPDKESSLLTRERAFTHGELMRRAAGIAARLGDRGLRGQTGIVSLKNGPEFFA